MPTGTTPRKRSWTFTDEWTLTKSREVVLRDWRRRESSSSHAPQSDDSQSDHLSVKEEPEEDNNGTSSISDVESEAEALGEVDGEHDDTITMNSPPPIKSLASSVTSSTSSTSSTASIAIPAPILPELKKSLKPFGTLKSGLPKRGTLTEKSTNVLAGRPSTRRTTRT
jgi:kinesin family member 11